MSRADLTKVNRPVKEIRTRTKLTYSNDTVSIECKCTIKSQQEREDLVKAISFLQLLVEEEYGC